VRSRHPNVKPATRLDPPGPSAHRPLSSDHHCAKWVTSGGAGQIGSKRLDPGAPTTPRPALPAGGGPAVDGARLPHPSFTWATVIAGCVVSESAAKLGR
jgi:hypothetical protein